MEYTKKFTISGWATHDIVKSPEEQIKEWYELGLTVMTAHSDETDWERTHKMLDEAEKYGIKLIIQDPLAYESNLRTGGEEHYRECMKRLIDEFGNHPATYGFYITDEPDADRLEATLRACAINSEMAPHLTAYMNLLPWFDWIGERMGTKEYAPYLDRVVKEGKMKLLSYDCYMQLHTEVEGYNDYFNNLREYHLASKRNGLDFWNIVLCTGHYDYKCPTKDELIWQLNTSVAHGAKGVSWFILDEPNIGTNYRNAPINLMGERTPEYYVLSEVNRTFNEYCGKVFAELTIDECYHVNKSFGGMPLFEPFGCVMEIEERNEIPLIISGYHDSENGKYFSVCNNSSDKVACITVRIKNDTEIEQCYFGNKFGEPNSLTDPVGELYNKGKNTKTYTLFLSPGQIVLFKEK